MMDRFKNLREGLQSKGFRADSTAMFEKSLTATLSRIQETVFSEAISQMVFPMAPVLGPGLTAIEYYRGVPTGEMQLIGPNSSDLPRMDESMERTERPVANYGGTFGWSLIEFERAQRQNYNFGERRAMHSRKISERKLDSIVFGESDPDKSDILGLFGYSLSPASGLTGGWNAATDQQILDDVQRVLEAGYTGSGGEIEPDTVLLGSQEYGILKYRMRTQTDSSLLEIVESKFREGQLNESSLTLRGLMKISIVFRRYLTGVFHSRIEYPGDKEIKKTKENI